MSAARAFRIGEQFDPAPTPLSLRERVLFHHLRSYGAAIFPKQQTIADKLNLRPGKLKWSLRTVNRFMQKLKDRNLVEVDMRGPTSSSYSLKKQGNEVKLGVASSTSGIGQEMVEQTLVGVPFGVAFGVASEPASLLLSEEELLVENTETHQHHRVFETVDHGNADDAAGARANPERNTESVIKPKPSRVFARAIEAELGWKLSRGDLAYCAELERRGLDAETVCAGVVVGRARKFCSDTNRGISDPPRSLRYFGGCIEQAARGEFSDDYVEMRRRWLVRHGGSTEPKGMQEARDVQVAMAATASG